jgi:hypothetical protein
VVLWLLLAKHADVKWRQKNTSVVAIVAAVAVAAGVLAKRLQDRVLTADMHLQTVQR